MPAMGILVMRKILCFDHELLMGICVCVCVCVCVCMHVCVWINKGGFERNERARGGR